MRTPYHDSVEANPVVTAAGRVAQKRRTRGALVAAAAALISEGRVPSMTAAAERADVSLATAYRYFPSAGALALEAGLEQGLPRGSDLFSSAEPADPVARIGVAAVAFQEAIASHEAAARAMQRIAVSGSGGSDAALAAMRAGRRIEVISAALEPLRDRIPQPAFDRLVDALCLVIGVDAFVISRDLRGLSVSDSVAVSRRAAQALVTAALAETA